MDHVYANPQYTGVEYALLPLEVFHESHFSGYLFRATFNIGLGGSGLSQSQIHQQLLRERSGLQSATNAADEVISQAQSQALALGQQRSLLIDIDSKVGSVGQKFPVMNSIMTSIRRKKSREQLILSAVVASCLLFIIIYWMNK